MSNPTPNQTTQPNQMPMSRPPAIPAVPQESIISKIIGGFTWWIGSLTGKPQVKKPSPAAVPSVKPEPNPDDPVAQDVEALKKLVGKFSTNVSSKVGPKLEKTVESTKNATSNLVQKSADNKGQLKNILKIFFIVFIILILGFVIIKFIKSGKGSSLTNKPSVTPSPAVGGTGTPTPIVFIPNKPSLYVDDPVVLKLEKDIDVLTREIAGTNIKETQLNTPALDYNISF